MQQTGQISCIGFWSEYDQCFFEKATVPGYTIKVINPAHVLAGTISPSLLIKPLRSFLLERVARNLLETHRDDVVIIHDERVMASALLKAGSGLNAHVLMRNIIGDNSKLTKSIRDLQDKKLPVWSFDHNDCRDHHFSHYNQFISKLDNYEHTPVRHDFGFLGKDKGRKVILDDLQRKLREQGFSCQIDLRVGARRKGSGLVDKSYKDYLAQSCAARCIIDIVQGNQSGITLRPLEAALYKRKLLTNNLLVKELPFYDPQNIFLLDHDKDRDLMSFMESPLHPIPEQVLSPYLTHSLLAKIARVNNLHQLLLFHYSRCTGNAD